MSYEWIRRRKRYLSFRYLFPELVAPWIQFKRVLLRILWFFTHPVDEFFDDLGELIAWPFVATAHFFAWILGGIGEFFKDLFEGIEAGFRYLGRLPVWTASAIAGTLGIIMTILLFFLQVASFEPVPLSAGTAVTSAPPVTPAAEPAWRPQPEPATPPQPLTSTPAPAPQPWRPTAEPLPGISLELARLVLPFDSRQRIDVVSSAPVSNPQNAWTHFDRMNASSGWRLTRQQGTRPALQLTPYVVRQPARNTPLASGWVQAEDRIRPFEQVQNSRQPGISITRTAPQSSSVGGPMTYEVLVSNQGLEPLDSVSVHERVSAIDRVMNVEPPARVVDDALVWIVSDLQPREQRRLTIELRPDNLAPVAGGSTVRVKTAVAAISRVTQPLEQAPPITSTPPRELLVQEPEPQPPVPAEPPPKQEIGMILPTFHDEPQPEPPPQQQEPPAQSWEPFATEPPQPEVDIQPLAPVTRGESSTNHPQPDEHVETARGTSGVPIFFEMRTPTLARVEKAVATVFEIRNPGSAPLTDLVILVEVTDELDHERGRILEHRIARLEPGAVYFTRLTTTAVQNGTARVRSTLTSAEDLQSTLEAEIKVQQTSQPPTQLSAIELPPQGRPTSTQ